MSNVQSKFIGLFKKALTDKEGNKEKSTRQKETDYYNLNFFINGLKKQDHFQICLDAYLAIYKDYLPADRRSKFVFAQLFKKRIEAAKPEDRFIVTVSDILADNQRPFTNPIRLRFEDLEDKEKTEIRNALDYKLQLKKQETSVLDLLKDAYEKERGVKPDEQALLNYNPVVDATYLEKFEALRSECRSAWGNNDAEGIEPALKKYISFLSKETSVMKLFQVIKWTRDVAKNQPYKVVTNAQGETQTYRHTHDSLDCELYFQAVFWILIWARKKLYQKNRWNFTADERGFFMNPLSGDYYFSNYYNRFEASRTDSLDIIKASVLFLRLLLFARISGGVLANDKEVTRVRSIIEDASLRPALRKKNFYLNVGRDLFKGYVRVGSNMGKANVIYFDEFRNNNEQFIYIEFADVKNILVKVSASRLAAINEDSFYTLVWEQTQHLLVLIPAFWKLIGYVVTFLTGGAFALVKDVAADLIIGEVSKHVAPSGSEASAVNLGFLLLRKGKINAGNLERAVGKGFKNLGEEEAKAAKALLKLSDEELKAARVAGKLTEEEVRAIKAASRHIDDEAKAMKAADELAVAEAKVANSKAPVISTKAKGTVSTGKRDTATAANPKLSTADDAVRNNGTGVTVIRGGDGKNGIPLPASNVPVTRGVIDWNDAVKMAEDMGEKSPWVKKLDDIGKVADPAVKKNEIRKFFNEYSETRHIEIEVIIEKNAQRRGLNNDNLWRYDADSNKIFLHEQIFHSRQINPMKEIREAVKTAEMNKAFKDLPFPRDFKTVVSGVPQQLRSQVKSLPDVIKMQSQPITITAEQAANISRDLHAKSIWMQELGRISRLDDAAKRAKELRDFAAVYSHDTPIKITILPANEAAARGLGANTGNWGTFVQSEKMIYMHEGVFAYRRAVNEVAHEVGAAELYRVFGISKDAIPLVSNPAVGTTGNYLTHTLDRFIRTPD